MKYPVSKVMVWRVIILVVIAYAALSRGNNSQQVTVKNSAKHVIVSDYKEMLEAATSQVEESLSSSGKSDPFILEVTPAGVLNAVFPSKDALKDKTVVDQMFQIAEKNHKTSQNRSFVVVYLSSGKIPGSDGELNFARFSLRYAKQGPIDAILPYTRIGSKYNFEPTRSFTPKSLGMIDSPLDKSLDPSLKQR